MRRPLDEPFPGADGRLPLASLRARLDEGSARCRWPVNPDGVLGRVLEVPAGSGYTVPLLLDGRVSLRARVMLYPHEWRDLRGAVRAAVVVYDADGRRRELWAGTLRTGDRGRPGGLRIHCPLPSGAVALALEVHRLRVPPANVVERAIWVAPSLSIPNRSTPRPAPARPPAARSAVAGGKPLFSVLMPVHDPPLPMLTEAVESVRAQTHVGWELCLVDDGSTDPDIITALGGFADDARIRTARHPAPRGISAATNTALELATGRYIALLDHDDTLAPDALAEVAAAIAADPSLDMVYTDEDIVDAGRQVWVHLKPAWSPDTLRTNGYTCHLGVYRRSLVQEVGGFRSAFDGSQDIDMILRLMERTERVAHVPRILYHWRAHPASTAGGDAKPYAYVAARRAYASHLERTGVAATVSYGPPGLYRVAAEVDPATPVTMALAVRSADGVGAAARAWLAQPHPAWKLALAAPATAHGALRRALADAGVDSDRVELLTEPNEPPSDAALARAAERAAADTAKNGHLLLLQAPAAGLTYDWLTRLLGYTTQTGIAAAGPVILAADGRVAHAGVALPEGRPLHLLRGSRTSMDDFFGYGTSVHNVSAVSGGLLTSVMSYRELGGLDPAFGELALIEYCLRATEAGGRIVVVPDARLRLTVADDAPNDLPATRALERRWSEHHVDDPYYNPGYLTDRGDFTRRAC